MIEPLGLTASSWLIRDVTHTEVKSALFQMNPDMAPGPDGYNARFFQQNWEVIKDVIRAVISFFRNGKLLKQINHTFLTLIPKTLEASSLAEYRPISCCNVIYKIISKILSNRLKKVVGGLISANQHAFLEGRLIGDCSLLSHELIRDFKKKHGKRACIKVDLQKAFDSVNREFIYFMLHCMNFPRKWICWIKECLSSPSFSVLNGISTGYFTSSRGVRQGDPISPYIFVLVMEFLSIKMELATEAGLVQNFKGRDLQISHLVFADDLLIFSRANKKSFEGLNNILADMELNTGLCINKSKSKVFYSKGCTNKDDLTDRLGISEGNFPVRYLGLPLFTQYPKASQFLPLIDKLKSKVDGWMAITLSFAGRLELIKSVLYSSLAYWFMSFHLPHSVIKEVTRICSNFLWKGKFHSMSWENVCREKDGGFGIRKITDIVDAAGLKMVWRLFTANSLWSTWMRKRYLKHNNFWETNSTLLDSGTWKHMVRMKNLAMQCMKKSIGKGNETSLWFDPWLPNGRLIDSLGREAPLSSNSSTWKVAKLIQNQKWVNAIPELNQVWNVISNTQLSGDSDIWKWQKTSTGEFSFASAWECIRSVSPKFEFHNTIWFPTSTPKMSACFLKAIQDRLPTRVRLKRFGIIDVDSCVLCQGHMETIDHLFFQCSFSSYIWSLCKLKLGMDGQTMGNLKHEAKTVKDRFKSKEKIFILSRQALSCTIWHCWQERNRRVFRNEEMDKIKVFRRIYEDVNILLRSCVWKVKNKEVMKNWGM